MKRSVKLALGGLMFTGAVAAIALPASAAVSVGIGVAPGYYGPAYPAPYPCSAYYPYYCGPAYYGYGPAFGFGGYWGGGWHGGYHGGFHGGARGGRR